MAISVRVLPSKEYICARWRFSDRTLLFPAVTDDTFKVQRWIKCSSIIEDTFHPDVDIALGELANTIEWHQKKYHSVSHNKASGSIVCSAHYSKDGTPLYPVVYNHVDETDPETQYRTLFDVERMERQICGHKFLFYITRTTGTSSKGEPEYGLDLGCISLEIDEDNYFPVVTCNQTGRLGAGWQHLKHWYSSESMGVLDGYCHAYINSIYASAQLAHRREWVPVERFMLKQGDTRNIINNVTNVANGIMGAEGMFKKFTQKGAMWSWLFHEALQDIGLCDNNGLAFVKDTASMASDVKSQAESLGKLVDGLKGRGSSVKKINKLVAYAASAYLSAHYGYKLQARDTMDYINALKHLGRNAGLSKSSSAYAYTNEGWRVTQRLQFLYDKNIENMATLSEFLRQLDALPTLENAWDMVPYSFVIDWFIGLGDVFSAIDNYSHVTSKYDTIALIRSVHAKKTLTASDLHLPDYCYTSVDRSYYGRLVSEPTRVIPLPISPSKPAKFNHWLELGALFAQRLP